MLKTRTTKFIAVIMLICMLFSAMQTTVLAVSVANTNADDAYFAQAVNAVKTCGIFEGYPDGTMGENNNVTRAEMAVICLRLLSISKDWEKNYTIVKSYPDVANDYWAAKYISKAFEIGIAQGDTEGNFRPSDNVTYDEATKMLLVAGGYNVDETGNTPSYPDGYRKIARENGIRDNIKCGNSKPISRGGIIIMTYQLLLSKVTMPDVSLPEGTYEGV